MYTCFVFGVFCEVGCAHFFHVDFNSTGCSSYVRGGMVTQVCVTYNLSSYVLLRVCVYL